MKRLIVALIAVLMSMGAVEVTAQSFLKKIGKTIESEVQSEVEKGTRRAVREVMAQPLPKKEAKTAQEPANQPQERPATQPETQTSPSNTKFYKPLKQLSSSAKYVKDIDVWYRIGRKENTYKLYKDGGTYYIDHRGEYHEVFSCDAIFRDVKYNQYVIFFDIELFIKEKLAGTPAPTVVRRD